MFTYYLLHLITVYIYFENETIFSPIVSFSQHQHVVFAMDIMLQVLVNRCAERVMHFYFQ